MRKNNLYKIRQQISLKNLRNKRKERSRKGNRGARKSYRQAPVLKGMEKKGLKEWLLSMMSWTTVTKASRK